MVHQNKRSSGVLMHISSLPGNTGIGTLGKHAFSFIDKLSAAGQSYWQLLPICPTGYGDSPYQSFSTAAGNPYFIDFEELVSDGLLEKSDYESIDWGNDERRADYGILYQNRRSVFEKAVANFKEKTPADFDSFCKENENWLDDYALFMAVKDAHVGAPLSSWEDAFRFRDGRTISAFKAKHKDDIEYYRIVQYFFFKQWMKMKKYANSKGIKLIGDLPIYVSADSVDVWASPDNFALNGNLRPIEVAGCPPDGFSATGQLWGNPVYNWEHMKKTNFTWWKKRLDHSLLMFDVIRIDHFRGFESYYCIPADSKTAENGTWRPGPGMELFTKANLLDKPIIAEDLGFLTDGVRALLKGTGFPGMKILQFAFDTRDGNDYIPEHYTENSVAYTGTHDNDTIAGWTKSAPNADVKNAMAYFSLEDESALPKAMMKSAMKSVSATCILTMQDILLKGSEARMNTPSTQSGNWQWRATEEELEKADWTWLKDLTTESERLRK
jgi:4-alpha-glucanotransferase